ncbi:helix-turn-helix domain-containing protein, partial [Saccharopolyspora shandongensis]|uniref:PucR family transcriptional regulator n=1 Tax=Saccharopolyspora shandongensis TaxID=418495 RepID=UPI00340A43C0
LATSIITASLRYRARPNDTPSPQVKPAHHDFTETLGVDGSPGVLHSVEMLDAKVGGNPLPLEPFVNWLDKHGRLKFSGLADQLHAEIPELGAADPDTLEALRASIVSHLPGMRATFMGSNPDPHLPKPAQDFAYLMARSNIPLSAVLRSYELGHAAIWNEFTSHLRKQQSWTVARRAEALESGSIRMFEYMQSMTGETITTYNRARDSLMRATNSRRNEIVRAVLSGNGGVRELRELFGYHIDEVHIGYVAWSVDPMKHEEVSELARRELLGFARQHVSVTTDSSVIHGWFTPCKNSTFDDLAAVSLPRTIRLTLGTPRRGIRGFHHTHREALSCVDLTALHTPAPTRFPDVAVTVLATQDQEMAARFVDDHLGALRSHEDGERLIKTLRHYMDAHASPTRCGQRLGIHPNTVTQRVQRAETILGRHLDPASLALRLALDLERTMESE